MIINLKDTDFTLNTGSYYSAPFKVDTKDTLLSIGVYLAVSGTASLQVSINETDWSDISESSFICNLFGVQIYSNADINLVYRIKTDQAPTQAQISI